MSHVARKLLHEQRDPRPDAAGRGSTNDSTRHGLAQPKRWALHPAQANATTW